MKKNAKKTYLYILCFFIVLQGSAQSRGAIFNNITPEDGLRVTTISDIKQDKYGFIWIGTWDGVFRYDGKNFEKKVNRGRYIEPDKKGGLWISFERQGSIAYYNTLNDSLYKYRVPSMDDHFIGITVTDDEQILAESPKGIIRFEMVSDSFMLEANQAEGAVYGLKKQTDGSVIFMHNVVTSNKWEIGKRSVNGLYEYQSFPIDKNNPGQTLPFNQSTRSQERQLTFYLPYGNSGVLLVNQFGWAIQKSWQSDWQFFKPKQADIFSNSEQMIIDSNNQLWILKTNTLIKFNLETQETSVLEHDPLNPKGLLSFPGNNGGKHFIDSQNILWIPAFSSGISRLNLNASNFGLLRNKAGETIVDVISAYEESDGSFWIGSRKSSEGLQHFDASGNLIESYSGNFDSDILKLKGRELTHPFVWSIAKTSDGSVWAGCGSPGPNNGGLNRILPGGNEIRRFKNDPEKSNTLSGNWIWQLEVDASDRLWIMSNFGVDYLDPKTEKITSVSSFLPASERYVISCKTNDGDIIISTEEKKHYLINHQNLSVQEIAKNIVLKGLVRVKLQDRDGRFWITSPNGFGRLDKEMQSIEKWYDISEYQLSIEQIAGSQTDEQNNIWLSTDNGILKFNTLNEEFTHYTYERGLQGHSFGWFLDYKGPSGKIYFGGAGGINIFDPATIESNKIPPKMVFTNLKLDGKTVRPGINEAIQTPIFDAKKITIQPNITTVSIEFSAIHFGNEKANKYMYILEGLDHEWQNAQSSGLATYTNLPAGKYTFKIKGSNLDGIWSDGSKSIEIIVLPPWYATTLAFIIYILLVVILVYSIIRWRTYKLETEKHKLEEKVNERTIELKKSLDDLRATQAQLIQSEKMASLGELTAGIAHEIQNPLNFVNNFSEVNQELISELREEITNKNFEEADQIAKDIELNEQKINHHGKRADAIVKGMLQHSRTSTGQKELTDINALADEYLRLAYHGLRAKDKSFNADFKTEFDETLPKMNVIPQDIGRVLLNLINNAFYAVGAPPPPEGGIRNDQIEYRPTVIVRTSYLPPPGGMRGAGTGWASISVIDNGPGIPASIIDKIF